MVTSTNRVLFLRCSLGLVLGAQAAALLLHPVGHAGVRPALLISLASLELVAALLVLAPRTVPAGVVLLLASLACAAALHVFLGEAPPASYLVSAAALWVVAADGSGKKKAATAAGPLSDEALFRSFEDASLPNEAFHHREHVRTAFLYLARHGDLAAAALHFRRALRRFAAAHGRPRLFHETLTWAYLVLVNERMRRRPFHDSEDFLHENPDLLSHQDGVLSQYYDVEATTLSTWAREVFVLPAARE